MFVCLFVCLLFFSWGCVAALQFVGLLMRSACHICCSMVPQEQVRACVSVFVCVFVCVSGGRQCFARSVWPHMDCCSQWIAAWLHSLQITHHRVLYRQNIHHQSLCQGAVWQGIQKHGFGGEASSFFVGHFPSPFRRTFYTHFFTPSLTHFFTPSLTHLPLHSLTHLHVLIRNCPGLNTAQCFG